MKKQSPIIMLKSLFADSTIRLFKFVKKPQILKSDPHVFRDYFVSLLLALSVLKGLPVILPMVWEVKVSTLVNEFYLGLSLLANSLTIATLGTAFISCVIVLTERRLPKEVFYFLVRCCSVFNFLIILLAAVISQRLVIHGDALQTVNDYEKWLGLTASIVMLVATGWLIFLPLAKYFMNNLTRPISYFLSFIVLTATTLANPGWTIGGDYVINNKGLCEEYVSHHFKEDIMENTMSKECLIANCTHHTGNLPDPVVSEKQCP